MVNTKEKVKKKSGETLICWRCKEPIMDDLWEGLEVEEGMWVPVHLVDCTGEEADQLAGNYSPDNL